MLWAAFFTRYGWLESVSRLKLEQMMNVYRLFMMAVFFYLMVLCWCLYLYTEYCSPFNWACEHFEWHWEML